MSILLVLSGFKYTVNFALAQQYPGPISMSMGGSGVAGFQAPESILLNPAAVNIQSPLDTDLIYQDGTVASDRHRTGLGLIISDNSEDVVFPGSLYYSRGSRKFYSQGAEEQLWSLAFGKRYSEALSFGLRLSYLDSTVANDKQYKQFNAGLGTIYELNESLSFGFAYENLASPDKDVPVAFRLVPEWRLGAKYKPSEMFGFWGDVGRKESANPDKKGSIHVGTESTSTAYTIFRIGMKWDDYMGQNFFTLGAGFDGPRLKANYSVQKALKGTGGALHGVDFRVTF